MRLIQRLRFRAGTLRRKLFHGGVDPGVHPHASCDVQGRGIHIHGRGGPIPHYCAPLVEPTWVPSAAARHMRDDDPVIGLLTESTAWAMPWWIMKNHHCANLELEGQPTMISLCEVCAGAGAWDPVVDGRRYDYRVAGVYNGGILFIDYQTGSMWTPFTGEAILGPMTGTRLERRPIVQCTWAEWRSAYPDTLVLYGKKKLRRGHGAKDRSPDVKAMGHPMMLTVLAPDHRMESEELVLGVVAGGTSRAYPLDALHEAGGVLDDVVGGVPILAISPPGTWIAVALERKLDGQTLGFDLEGTVLVDRTTGTRWDLFGRALSGPLEGRRLAFAHSGLEKWYAWAATHPGTELWSHVPGPTQERDPVG